MRQGTRGGYSVRKNLEPSRNLDMFFPMRRPVRVSGASSPIPVLVPVTTAIAMFAPLGR